MRRTIFLTTFFYCVLNLPVNAQQSVVDKINEYGKLDRWWVREVRESDFLGGKLKYLYEFYGNGDTHVSREPLVKPDDYLWRTNNVLACVAGIYKTNTTVFPERRGDGWCARIETHIEDVEALGINLHVVCQGAFLLGDLIEPIKSTKDPMTKVVYGIPFSGFPKALVFDYKAEVGHAVVRGTGFSKIKTLDRLDYPEAVILLQKRWEDEDGTLHALRVGTGQERFTRNVSKWENGHRIEVKYGDITSDPSYKSYMKLETDPDRAYHAFNCKGRNVPVIEEGWAPVGTEPNYLIVKFLASCDEAFHGGVGNIVWIDNIRLEM